MNRDADPRPSASGPTWVEIILSVLVVLCYAIAFVRRTGAVEIAL
jgi:hypothetical protein